MKPKYSKISITFAVFLVVMTGISTVNLLPNNENNGSFTLIMPVAAAETGFLNQEAGISAYTNVGQTIDISKVKTAFRTIEKETGDYIIGSVPLYDYDETEDTHVYVHKDGWIVSYYLKEEPAAKIVDWNGYGTDEQITETKLDISINIICATVGVITGEITYYDFRHPNANKLMIVADAIWGGSGDSDSFEITLPSDFIFYERSYSLYCSQGSSYSGGSGMEIDDERVGYLSSTGANYDFLSPSHLAQGVSHTVKLTKYTKYYEADVFDAIVLIYGEP